MALRRGGELFRRAHRHRGGLVFAEGGRAGVAVGAAGDLGASGAHRFVVHQAHQSSRESGGGHTLHLHFHSFISFIRSIRFGFEALTIKVTNTNKNSRLLATVCGGGGE